MKKGNKYGVHRVLEPKGVLPQPADKIDNNMEIYDNEILIDVQTLNIDSASFTQIEEEAGGDVAKIKEKMKEIVAERGKHHNPVTGSGGMLIGTVEKIGPALEDRDIEVGDKIATLVSLSLTPLRIDKIKEVKQQAQEILAETDWYITRQIEQGDAIPTDVLDYREIIRDKSDIMENEIYGLETKLEVYNYEIDYEG